MVWVGTEKGVGLRIKQEETLKLILERSLGIFM